jgi:predicted lipoprotein with Yx(FWY)xxD motif
MDRSAKKVVVSVTKNATFGKILVSGKTLYILKQPSSTACTSACVKIWPELVLPKGVKKATAGSGVKASKLGTIHRAGGALQVTYGGKPLYFFSIDSGPGMVTGNVTDTWGKWTDVVVGKAKATHTASPPATSSSGGAGF